MNAEMGKCGSNCGGQDACAKGQGDKTCRKAFYLQAALMTFFVIVLDQLSKWMVLEFVIRKGLKAVDVINQTSPVGLIEWLVKAPERLPLYSLSVLPFFNITMVWNDGVSFGLLASDGFHGKLFLIIMSLGISAFLGFLIYKTASRFEALAMAAVIGGALGNVLDRLRFGAVADFLDFHMGGYHFPVFNVADSAISIGIAFLLIFGLFWSGETTKESKDS